MSEPSSVASWLGEKSEVKDSEWTRERDEAKKKSAEKEKNSSKKDAKFFREMNKRLKAVYEDSGLDFGADAEDEDTILDRFTVATKCRKKQIAGVFKQIRRARDVELCFLVDCTGSMTGHIDAVRDQILKIVDQLTGSGIVKPADKADVQDLKLGFVAYRDIGDPTEVLKFTNSVTEFRDFCSKLRAFGGGADLTEDVFGGLELVLGLNWSEKAGTKVMFHICDYPCHGSQYHRGVRDSYPAGDPNGRTPENLLTRLREIGVQYHFGKITEHTELMIEIFSEIYGEPIVKFDIKNVTSLTESVTTSVSLSVSASISASKSSASVKRKERTYVFMKSEPNWISCPTMKGKFLSYDFPDSLQDIIDDVPIGRRQSKSAEVKIAGNPFSKGAERVAFYGRDVSTYVDTKAKTKGPPGSIEVKHKAEDIVLKEYLHLGKGMNSAKRYELSNQMQTIASFLAKEFSTELKKHFPTATTLKFLKIRTLFVGSTSGDRFMSCERRFSATDKFVRFSNNASYGLTEKKAVEMGVPVELLKQVMAFSHWTYKASNRFLMVVDLEGIVSKELSSGETIVLMTDPAIHCQDLTRYGRMNHGSGGMNGFFSKHECNHYCHALGLKAYLPLAEDSD